MEIQFLTDEPVDTSTCVRYRCAHLQEQLAVQGIDSSLSYLWDAKAIPVTGDVVVLFRTAWWERVQGVLDACRARGKAVVFGTDDLVFAEDFVWKQLQDGRQVPGRAGRRGEVSPEDYWQDYVAKRQKTFALCDGALVSTDYLAERVRALGKPAWVVRNGLSQELEARSREAPRDRTLAGGRVVLGYLSGTASHNYDFAEIADVVAALMRRHRHVYLTVVGPLDLPAQFDSFGPRVRRLPFLPWRQLPSVIANLDINLAPLDMLQPFNHAKSEVKWLEAAAVGVVTIASRTRGLAEAVRDGETGLLADTPDEWERLLEELVTQPDLRARLGAAARREVEQRYTVKALSPRTAEAFIDIAHRYTRPPAGPGGPATRPPVIALPRPERRPLARRLRRALVQTARNVARLLNPSFWDRVLSRWEGTAE